MDSQSKFQTTPLPLESEFRIASVRSRLSELTREEIEEFLIESLSIMTALANQVTQMRKHIEKTEG